MSTGPSVAAFVVGAAVALATSWLLVSRLERLGARFGLSEALLGLVAALAADAPEITAAVTALSHHQRQVGAGVTIGSNVFNLAALLGLGAMVAGRIHLHRRVVVLGGAVGVFIALVCLLATTGTVAPLSALVFVLAALALYGGLLAAPTRVLGLLRVPEAASAWLRTAVAEEEAELEVAIHPTRGTPLDATVAAVALVVVVASSVAMERGATTLGRRFGVAEIVIGGLVLAAVTSLPNAVAAIYLARRGRGAAALSTALNSNAINVAAGLLLPAAVVGLARPTSSGLLVAGSYLGLTVVTVALAYVWRGLGRASGSLLVGLYGMFVVALVLVA
jgi:cation:H+ antiporter